MVTDEVSALPPELPITRYDPDICPAVYVPPAEIVPPVALHVVVSGCACPSLHVAVAVNCCVAPFNTEAEGGVTASATTVGGETVSMGGRGGGMMVSP